jgi:hypothetical protein
MSEGELLTGDGVTQGIVRIGDTVRRPLRPFSLTVQAYLAHLRDAGFTGAPLPFGVDEQGREVQSFVPGDVPRNPLPPETAGDDVLVALARLIRALHEASAGWVPPPDAVWGGTPANPGQIAKQAELVSHRDYYPGQRGFPRRAAARRGVAARGGPGDHRSPRPARLGRGGGASDGEVPVATREIQRSNNQEKGCPSVDAVREADDARGGRDTATGNTRDPVAAEVAVLPRTYQTLRAGSRGR